MYSDHFQGKYEVELKYRLKSKSDFLDTLHQMPHETMLEENAEADRYYDTPDRALNNQNKILCIRTMEPSGIKLWIVKGPEPDRCEATNITDADRASSMLETMGYEVALQVEKVRSIYFIGKFHITVDSLENIGDFAEFAIMTDEEESLSIYKKELEELAFKFGLTNRNLETKSYKDMATEITK
ncbi:class IV adenylate cyclase [Vibrio algarum]|uniref:Class IV adenylate cyclase n=1 Tax=Vibrio algarum TaxID=3020714 RepID=A0ABT4YUW1_9VIBR|nr:class IV adenylate cyclase [Vibrio sp. KJ40-1]MDB1125375.1 class IV adenylate cyclase [Vibrio sp. KJ40-1]